MFNSLEAQASFIIRKYEKEYSLWSDLQLSNHSQQLKQHFTDLRQQNSPQLMGERVTEFLPQTFGLVREAAFRELGYRHHKEQLMAGIALSKGNLAQMQTGEGKTLAITAPAYLAALTGRGVHIITANDYLARRDCEEMGAIYSRLGVSCAVITTNEQFRFSSKSGSSKLQLCSRHLAYQADITYGTASAFGFDYLRDHLGYRAADLVQRQSLAFAILDEADNILLDEARTPLIISGKVEVDITLYYQAVELVRKLISGQDYEVNRVKQTASFTEKGINKLENWLNFSYTDQKSGAGGGLYNGERSELYFLDNCLKALTLYHRNEDYLVTSDPDKPTAEEPAASDNTYPRNDQYNSIRYDKRDQGSNRCVGQLVLIDKVTGRPMLGRRLGGGLHEALEAKEGLEIKTSTSTLATISLQAYFKQYKKLAGLSGTLETDKDILYRLYGLETVIIGTHRPLQRIEAPALVYRTRWAAIYSLVETVLKVRESGAPVLVGTPSVVISEEVSAKLKARGIPHQVLNARQTDLEAKVIARAGYPGRITVATNMAGRGTDILLGGKYEDHLVDLAKHYGLVKEADAGTAAWQELEKEAQNRHRRAKEIVYGAGGLHVLGLGLQSSRRLDRQLIGRAGRQGDPGYSQFFYSLEDDLVTRYAGDSSAYRRLLSGCCGEEYESEIPTINSVTQTQKKSSEVLTPALALKLVEECQRKAEGSQLDILVYGIEFDSVLNQQRELFYRDRQVFLFTSALELKAKILELISPAQEDSPQSQLEQIAKRYRASEMRLGRAELANRLRKTVLETMDLAWIQYLTPLEELRQGIGLRAYGGQKPLYSYQREASRLWRDFQNLTRHDISEAVQNELDAIDSTTRK
ncbi:MAG TPA: DEAD/DEAH box helicase [Chloroflexia bacterium]|nr:DEAD/DEAH box helicase [Chloroflexia bacterium]